MKYRILRTLSVSCALCAISFSPANAAVLVGDVLRFDFNNSLTATNWNTITISEFTTVSNLTLVTDALRYSDGLPTGVSFSVTANNGGGVYGQGAASSSASIPGWETGATGDVIFYNNDLPTDTWVLTLEGLNDSLSYDINIFGGVTGGTTDRPTAHWSNDGFVSTDVTFEIQDNVNYVTIAGATSTGGVINLSSYTSGVGNSGIINAIELVAIPEPETYALALGIVCLAILGIHRRRT